MMGLIRIGLAAILCAVSLTAQSRETLSFDSDWHFLKSDAPGAGQPGFNDSSWRKLNVPHDWSIEGPFSETNKTGGAGAFLPAGIGWYRKEFSLPAASATQRFYIEFDGVMANSDVWINGFHLGHRPYGYVSFGYELTGHLNFGSSKTNVIAVRADNSQQPASRWYSGAGIYRHVRLIITDTVHFEPHASFVSTPAIQSNAATVHIETRVVNNSASSKTFNIVATVYGPPHSAPDGSYASVGESAPVTVPAGNSADVKFDVRIPWAPRLWSLEHPDLHRASIRVQADGKTLDEDSVGFGVREFEFSPTNGFSLNGKNFKLYGVCLHGDGSAFGAAVPLGVWEHRLATLKQLGVNAIRTAHNPPAPEFLDLCDRMGFLVMDEFFDCWTVGKNPYDYHLFFNEWSKMDARDTIRRDRNHPSIILYSVGNEIHDTPKADLAKGILKGLVEVCHENDPTRPVTQALFRPNVSHDYDNGLADMLDVIGTNYRDNELLAAQRQKPSRKIVGTEQRHDRQTWLWLRDNPSHSGQFLWSGVDYLGESRRWPVVAAGSGLLDRTGEIKPMGYERQSWWSDKPMVFAVRRAVPRADTPDDPGFVPLDRRQILFPDWTPRNLNAHQENVEVYSNCEEVELFLNGKSLGAKPLPRDASPRNWEVKFAPGTLKAVARNKNRIVAEYELRTAGKPAKILLSADDKKLSPSWDDVSFITATVVDGNGIVVPNASDLISFKVAGPGVIAAVDSADNSSHESFLASERHAYQGSCQAIIKATAVKGRITVTATAAGLASASTTLAAEQ
jgi:beta-galactosidase